MVCGRGTFRAFWRSMRVAAGLRCLALALTALATASCAHSVEGDAPALDGGKGPGSTGPGAGGVPATGGTTTTGTTSGSGGASTTGDMSGTTSGSGGASVTTGG